MKFIFADSLDMIDPAFDFDADRMSADREQYWGDVYPHEYFPKLPYDGVLVSRGVVGDDRFRGKYPDDLMMRFRRVGARAFLRLTHRRFAHMSIFGDCGAFSYAHLHAPPYTPAEMLDFYADGQFTHGCSVDHIIFAFDENARALKGGDEDARWRFDVTLENAAKFLKLSRGLGRGFTPLGVIQGWSPASMAHAASRLEQMGYRYLAVGGLVPLNARKIHLCLDAIRQRLSSRTKLHLLGFAKAEQIHEFVRHRVTSFDTTSPLRRAFKDARANYYHLEPDGALEYFTAIRVPHATENTRLKRRAKASGSAQEQLQQMERTSLEMLRRYANRRASIERTLDVVVTYSLELLLASSKATDANGAAKEAMATAVRRTLEHRPWEKCRCRVCREAGIETVIFRGSNRNKRRGFHNIAIYNEYIKRRVQ